MIEFEFTVVQLRDDAALHWLHTVYFERTALLVQIERITHCCNVLGVTTTHSHT